MSNSAGISLAKRIGAKAIHEIGIVGLTGGLARGFPRGVFAAPAAAAQMFG